MRIYDTGRTAGRTIRDFGSTGAVIASLVSDKNWHIASLTLEPNGVLGAHKTEADQLLIIVEGVARVSSQGQKPLDVSPGTAVFWSRGEEHETRAGSRGLTAIIIEGSRLERGLTMPRKRVAG